MELPKPVVWLFCVIFTIIFVIGSQLTGGVVPFIFVILGLILVIMPVVSFFQSLWIKFDNRRMAAYLKSDAFCKMNQMSEGDAFSLWISRGIKVDPRRIRHY